LVAGIARREHLQFYELAFEQACVQTNETGRKLAMGKQTCILLIEDDPLDAEFVKRAMKNVSFKHSLIWASDLEEAIRLSETQSFDAILSDLSLPDSVGIGTVARLRSKASQTPIIVLTSSNDQDLEEKILAAGAQDYIPKEAISGDVLGRAIRHAIQRHSQLIESKNLLREIDAARELLAAKNKKLEQLYKQAHDFVDNVSHEFRTPLTVIKEYSSLIREGFVGIVNKEQVHMLDIIENRVDDLNTMVDDMLDSSKLESGLIGAWRKPCSVEQILEHVTAAMDRKAQIKGVTLTWEVADDLPMLYCDAEKIGRVLINLGVNALKFCGSPGEVHLSVYQESHSSDVTFSVKDNGAGIETENLKQIFERFRQLGATAHTSCKGFGLGLAIAKELVELNFGSLSVASNRGNGSKFFFTVPVNDSIAVMNRYLEFIKRAKACTQMVTLVSVRADTNHDPEVLEAFEEFLNFVCRCNDLLFRCQEDAFLLVLATDRIELQPFLDRAQQLWESTNRNCPRGPLPEVSYEYVGTWPIDKDGDSLVQTLANLIGKEQVTCA